MVPTSFSGGQPTKLRCQGAPVGGRYGGLGTRLTPEGCQAACAAEPTCGGAIHRPVDGSKGPCTSFPKCDDSQKSKYAFGSWKKVKGSSPPPAPTYRQPDPTPNP